MNNRSVARARSTPYVRKNLHFWQMWRHYFTKLKLWKKQYHDLLPNWRAIVWSMVSHMSQYWASFPRKTKIRSRTSPWRASWLRACWIKFGECKFDLTISSEFWNGKWKIWCLFRTIAAKVLDCACRWANAFQII